jgi:hypothetical protein
MIMIEYKNTGKPVPARMNPTAESGLVNIYPKNSILYVLSEDAGWLRLYNGSYVFKTEDIKIINDFANKSTDTNLKQNIQQFGGSSVAATIPQSNSTFNPYSGKVTTAREAQEQTQQTRGTADAIESAKQKTTLSEIDKKRAEDDERKRIELKKDIEGKQIRANGGARQYVIDENGQIKKDKDGNLIYTTYSGDLTELGNGSSVEDIDKYGIVKVRDSDGNIVYIDGADVQVFDGATDNDYKSIDMTESMMENRENERVQSIIDQVNNDNTGLFYTISNINNIDTKNIQSIFGYPYQFLPRADPRSLLNSNISKLDVATVNEMMKVEKIGRKFMQRIASRAPVLVLVPGTAQFLKGFSDKNKAKLVTGLVGTVSENAQTELEQMINGSNGQYYSFKETAVAYYKSVNYACRALSIMLGIGNVPVTGVFSDDTGTVRIKDINWFKHSQHNVGYYAGAVLFYVNSEPQVHENFQNSTRPSALSQMTNQLSDKALEVQFIMGGLGAVVNGSTGFFGESGIESNIASSFMDYGSENHNGVGLANSMIKNISTFLSGGKMIFPEIWSDSSFQRSYNVTIKLISPDSDKISIFFNVLVPLVHILGFVLPRSAGDNAYVSPYLVRGWFKSMFNIELGIIENCEVTKGEKGAWNASGLPRSITVQLSIKDLYHNMSQSIESNFNTLCNNPAQLNYLANLVGVNVNAASLSQMISLWMALKTGEITDTIDMLGPVLQRKVYNWVTSIIPVAPQYVGR